MTLETSDAPDALRPGTTLWIPPPAQRAWTDDEARALLRRWEVEDTHIVVVCDDDPASTRRLRPLLAAVGTACIQGSSTPLLAHSAWPGLPEVLSVAGAGRVEPGPGDVVLWRDALGEALVVRRSLGHALLTVIGSGSVLRNDGLLSEDNTAFALRLLATEFHRVDESHHHRQRSAVLVELWGRAPIRVALAAALLLPLLAALSLGPRPGDGPRVDDAAPYSPARAAVEGLAAWARVADAAAHTTSLRRPPP